LQNGLHQGKSEFIKIFSQGREDVFAVRWWGKIEADI
jgi:hypothetical protein